MASQLEFKFKYIEKKSAKEEKFDRCRERIFRVFNWLSVLVITSLSFFTGITQTDIDIWDMTLYCDSEKFNRPLSTTTKSWAIITILVLTLATVIMMSIKMFMFNKMNKDIVNIGNYFIGFLLIWDITYTLQNVLSYPIPSYYTNDQLKWHYCCKNCPEQKLTVKMQELDLEYRGSFPSFLMCALCYTTTFFYLFTCLLDTSKNFAAKLITLIVPGLITMTYGWLLWSNNENHLEDIIAGSFIGVFLATYIMKDLLIKTSKFDRFTGDFISVLVTREIELARLNSTENSNREERTHVNEYTINLCSHDTNQTSTVLEDNPPPYSSI